MHSSRNDQELTSTLMTLLKLAFLLAGLLSIAVGSWMLSSPGGWYELFPGAIPDTGPSNEHFIRDLGAWNLAGGILFLFAFANPLRFAGVALMVGVVANGAHAIVHISDVVSGRLPSAHWVIDLPLVFAPVILWGVLIWIWIRYQGQSRPERASEVSLQSDDEETPGWQ